MKNLNASEFPYLQLLLTLCLIGGALTLSAQPFCQNDTLAPVAACSDLLVLAAHPTDGVVITPDLLDENSLDDCTPQAELDFRLELSTQSTGEAPSDTVLTLPPAVADYFVILWVGDAAGNWNTCWTEVQVSSLGSAVEGQLFVDDNLNCALDAGESDTGFAQWTVRGTHLNSGEIYHTVTDDQGRYSLLLSGLPPGAAGDILVEALLPAGVSTGCPTATTLSNAADGLNQLDFPVGLVNECELLTVDVGTPFLRRCFPNTYYVSYCNYSAAAVSNVEVTITLDDDLILNGASLPYTEAGDQQYLFAIDSLAAATCGTFTLDLTAGCELELGATRCVTATITPHDCDPPAADWSGASLQITGECDEAGGEVRFRVRNAGAGDLDQSLDYQVVEDVVMYMEGEIEDLPGGAESVFTFPANGATWHFSLDQATGHPGQANPIAFVEGCGGLTPGMVNQFSLDDADPNVSIECREVIGAFDPNDKQAFPRGYGEAHFIRANEAIEYLIRFQNTGTDTAFNVVVEDQLSEYLDPATLRAGSSSHDYRVEVLETGLVRFYFDDIMLPDSNVNEPASHGFVKFYLEQRPDNPDGTLIENTAAIYFDFNEPILTNTTLHTIGEAFVLVSTDAGILPPGLELTVAPNPLRESARFSLSGYEVTDGRFQLVDARGQVVRRETFQGAVFTFHRYGLPPGLYAYRLLDGSRLMVTGKIIIH